MTRTAVAILVALLIVPAAALGQVITGPANPREAAPRVTMDAQLSQAVLAQDRNQQVYLDITLTPQERQASSRVPLNVALVIDKSGSMSGSDKIGYARDAAMSIVDQLESYDRVAIVTFDSNVQVLQPSTLVTDKARIKRLIAGIQTGSNTALHGGMVTGAEQVRANYNAEFLNRVIVLSDGKANVGPSSIDQLARSARGLGDEGISVTAMGLGLDYNEDTMTAIADAAGGNYYFIESGDQMVYQFQQELHGMMQVVAMQSTLTITTAGGVTIDDVYGYDYTRSGNAVTVRVGDLMGGRPAHVTALVSARTGAADHMALATVDLAYTDAVDGIAASDSRGVVAELSAAEADQTASIDFGVGERVQAVKQAEATTEAMEAFSRGDDVAAQAIVATAADEARKFESAAAGAGYAPAAPMAADMDSLMLEMEEAADDSYDRGKIVKDKKAGARSKARGSD